MKNNWPRWREWFLGIMAIILAIGLGVASIGYLSIRDAYNYEVVAVVASLRDDLAEVQGQKAQTQAELAAAREKRSLIEAELLWQNAQLQDAKLARDRAKEESKKFLGQLDVARISEAAAAKTAVENAAMVSYLENLLKLTEPINFFSYTANDRVKIKPVLFIPADYSENQAELERDSSEVSRALSIVRAWYKEELGITFSFEKPVVFRGKFISQEYRLPKENLVSVLLGELGSSNVDTRFAVFGYGDMSEGYYSLAQRGGKIAFFSSTVSREELTGPANLRYAANTAVAHELGHLFGLPHSSSPFALMAPEVGKFPLFPEVELSASERAILKKVLGGD